MLVGACESCLVLVSGCQSVVNTVVTRHTTTTEGEPTASSSQPGRFRGKGVADGPTNIGTKGFLESEKVWFLKVCNSLWHLNEDTFFSTPPSSGCSPGCKEGSSRGCSLSQDNRIMRITRCRQMA